MRVMLTVNAAWNVWNFRRSLVSALLEDGHDVSLLACPDESVSSLRQMGCRFIPLEMSSKGVNPIEGLSLIKRFGSTFRAERPDVVLSYTIKNNVFGALAARSAGVPFIPNVTGLGTAFLSGSALRLVAEMLYRRAFRHLPVVFFQNHDDSSLFVERALVAKEQAHVLPGSGIDLVRFAPQPYPGGENGSVFLMIGRLLRDKGVVEFVEAARRVKSMSPAARFQLLGPLDAGNRSAIDRATVEGWVSEGVVEYLGATDDVRPYIAGAHCVVLPSYREGAPRTLIEAAAMARPVIATDVPGCRSVVDDERSGLLCRPQDADSLARAMLAFIAQEIEDSAEMGRAGREKMELEYDEAHVIAAYRRTIEQLAVRGSTLVAEASVK